MPRHVDAAMVVLGGLLCGSCVGQTGGTTVVFPVAAAGPADAVAGTSLSFSANGFDIVLTKATLHIGAVYLDESQSVSGGQATGCYLTGTYVAQETSSLDVDLLDPTPHRFPTSASSLKRIAPIETQRSTIGSAKFQGLRQGPKPTPRRQQN